MQHHNNSPVVDGWFFSNAIRRLKRAASQYQVPRNYNHNNNYNNNNTNATTTEYNGVQSFMRIED